ncbi:MAG: sugar phosphate isomerase/epimerase [Spirochaetes bacterium]|nr:MAG: sugar phosphate isomerase/epimerase [Spirochaetota bacterium]RKX85748.1 MAG: sugar phosphate isomerase/epimerase [Spirochaetota bacterium]RKX90565.1 MAG: sugar phosphate isomerase/epimerase [Spirochaetota bacterium]
MNFKIGVLIDSLRMPFSDALKETAKLSVDSIQMYISSHQMSTGSFDFSDVNKISKQVRSHNLEISALVGDLGGHGFERKDDNKEKIPQMKAIVDFAQELEANIITTHIGVIPEHKNDRYLIMQEALAEIAAYAKTAGIYLAVETGPEKSAVLNQFIADTGETHLKVNFDPANIVMVQGEDLLKALETLKKHIVYTHAKDGKMIKKCNPAQIYNAFAEGNPENLNIDEYFVELALGSGDVNFPDYLKALDKIGYSGSLTIEREAGENRLEDVKNGVAFLRRIING